MAPVTIIDYGMGNLHSVARKLQQVGADVEIVSDPGRVANARKLVLPGVGHFKQAMTNLHRAGLLAPLHDAVLERKVPVLGICLGMQLFADWSEEGGVEGLGWVRARVVRLRVTDTLRYKVPHIGWNDVRPIRPSTLLAGLETSAFYFAHSYHLVCDSRGDVLCETDYSYPFASAVERANIVGVQFHPEKSHAAGQALLAAFVGA